MPFYGSPELDIEYTFVAVVPFDAEHPIGSGTVVHYEPGDEFPGAEWGMSAHNLVEVGKAVRLAVNVGAAAPPVPAAAPTTSEEESEEEDAEEVEPDELIEPDEEVTSYPHHGAAGWWTLSDGTKIRGEEAALQAQAELNEGDQNE